jgi:hypothetical protein
MLDSGGVINGTVRQETGQDYPTTYNFSVVVTDKNGTSTLPKNLSIVINLWTGDYVTISGTVYDGAGFPLNGVLLRGLPNAPTTGDDGTYSATVPQGWSGTVTPFKVGYFFDPESKTYSNIQTSQTDQDYSASNWLVKQEWVARYNGPAASCYDYTMGMALDSQGNVYVTGYSENGRTRLDYTTVKFDTSGNLIWVANYDGPRYLDEAMAITVDSSSNVYVTGWSYGTSYPAFPMDALTIKYDSDGIQQWLARYDSSNSDVNPIAIAADASGNVYVTGESYSRQSDDASDFITLKYNSSGTQLWAVSYDGPGLSTDKPVGIAVDSNGNVYITGTSMRTDDPTPPQPKTDIVTVKYNNSGVQQWVQTYNGNEYWSATPVGIAVHPAGEVFSAGIYVAGQSIEPSTGLDYVVINYNSSGDIIWKNTYSYASTSADYARAMALDQNGRVFVTGHFSLSGTPSLAVTVGFNADGNQIWLTSDGYPDYPTALAVNE